MLWCGYMLLALLESMLVARQVAPGESPRFSSGAAGGERGGSNRSFANVPLACVFATFVLLYMVCLAERYNKPSKRERLVSLKTSEDLAHHLRKTAAERAAGKAMRESSGAAAPESKKTL